MSNSNEWTCPELPDVCRGIYITVDTSGINEQAVRDIAKNAAATLPGEWQVKELAPMMGDCKIVSTGSQCRVGHGWDCAYQLMQHERVLRAEPSVALPGLIGFPRFLNEPQTDTVTASSTSVLPDEDDLPCSDAHDWSLGLTKVHQAWQLPRPDGSTTLGEGIKIGHPDTGYTVHDELDEDRLLVSEGYNFYDDLDDPKDLLDGQNPGHGTFTASVVMSGTGDTVTGAAPAAGLVPLRVDNDVVHFWFGTLAEAIHYAVDKKHHVISMSLGGPTDIFGTLRRAVQRAVNEGVILLAAAGNYWPIVVLPAAYNDVVGVAACDCAQEIWQHSATGPAVDVTAPGASVWYATVGSGAARGFGTSFAVATTAGICALWLSYHGRDNLIQKYGKSNLSAVFKHLLKTSGVDTPTDWDTTNHGTGIVNAEKLLNAPLPEVGPPTPAAAAFTANVSRMTPNRLSQALPGQNSQRTLQTFQQLLRADDRDQFAAATARHGQELMYHLAVNPGLRRRLLDYSEDPSKKKKPKKIIGDNPMLMERASDDLKERLGI